MRHAAAILGLGAALAGSACGAGLSRVTAPPGDYAEYRAFRTAPSLGERLDAAARYVERRPDGAFRAEVAAWFAEAEPLFYAVSAESAAGVEAYLAALPAGPHAAAATQKRAAFRAEARAAAGEGLSVAGAAFERRLAVAAQSREDVTTAYSAWIARLLDFEGWGRPLAGGAKGDLAAALEAEPKAKCGADRCSKALTLRYELEIDGKPAPFVCQIEITVRLAKDRVVEAAISGPDLFSRLAEAHRAEPVAADAEGRARAIAWAVELTSGVLERRLPRARCGKDPAPPAALARACDGFRVELSPKPRADAEDQVVIRGPGGL